MYPVVRYNPILPLWTYAYAIAHFLLLLIIFMHFEYDRSGNDWTEFSLKIAFVVCTVQSFGAIFDLR